MRKLRAWPVLVSLLAAPAPGAEPLAPRVTSDSPEYCDVLAQRLTGMPQGGHTLPRLLGEEGRRLCATGHVRTGIAKLRRAIRLANETRAAGG